MKIIQIWFCFSDNYIICTSSYVNFSTIMSLNYYLFYFILIKLQPIYNSLFWCRAGRNVRYLEVTTIVPHWSQLENTVCTASLIGSKIIIMIDSLLCESTYRRSIGSIYIFVVLDCLFIIRMSEFEIEPTSTGISYW